MTSIASAGCCDWGVPAPIAYAPAGCGGCGAPTAAIIYAQPVAPAPVIVSTWNTGCGCQRPVVYAAPAPIYVVNQGPEYAGPGLMVPYRTWSPAAAYAPESEYPYIRGYGYGAPPYGVHHLYRALAPRVVYREQFYAHPHYYRPMPR